MNAAETIQAAIDKLTRQREAATQGPWHGRVLNHWGHPAPGVWAEDEDEGGYIGYLMNQPDADLVVTLHATLDAQLAILNIAAPEWRRTNNTGSHDEPNHSWQALELARAILGEQADA